jgi:hypothetical protein
MRSAEEKHQNDESIHPHDDGDGEQPAELPTGPGTDADGVTWAPAPEPWDDYLVADTGRVVSLKSGTPHEMSFGVTWDSYGWVGLCNEGEVTYHRINRLVWQSHRGPIPEGHEIHHVNNEKLDNRLENLECVSGALHRRKHTAKLSEEEAAYTRWMTDNTDIDRQRIADHFGVSQATVWGIAERRSWQDIEPRRPDRSTIERIRNAA